MANKTILSLALLKASWDENKHDYLETFVPLVAECIRQSSHEVVSVPELQRDFTNQFGLIIPQNAIKAILNRVKKHGYLRLDDKVFKKIPTAFSNLNFHEVQQQVVGMHEALVQNLIGFCADRLKITLTIDKAETALQAYLEDKQILVESRSTQGHVIPATMHPLKKARFLVASFVQHLQETHAAALEYLETIMKGNMIANAIFLPDPTKTQTRFRKTEIYLDTSFLIYALGYAGKPRKDPCTELLTLLYETGANLRCFKHTIEEARGILEACAHRIQSGQLKDAYGPSIDYFVSKGFTPSDIELFSLRLERDLDGLRISILDKPPYLADHMIDEQKLTTTLEKELFYRNQQALRRDVDSISAIVRLRRGDKSIFIEECRALFITTNTGLAKITKEFFSHDDSVGPISPCLTDYTLTNILWLKNPILSPDLPRKRIIADCYAALQPDEKLWRRYLNEIEKLDQSRQSSPDDVYLLRHSLYAKTALMELTLGEEEAFTNATVPEILAVIEERNQAGIRRELETAEQSRRAAEQHLQTVQAIENERQTNIHNRAQKYAKKIVLGIELAAILTLTVGTAYTFPWDLPPVTNAIGRYLLGGIQVVCLFLTMLGMINGTNFETYARKAEVRTTNWIKRKIFSLTS